MLLDRLSARANLLFRDGPAFRDLHAWLARQIGSRTPDGDAACLMDQAACRGATDAAARGICVPSQGGFWLFVLKEALELHVARTLALLAAHPTAQQRARDELRTAAAMTPAALGGQHFLEACLLEQMRLWTPVPLLLRRATRCFELREALPVAARQQLLVHAAFHHRDPQRFGARADRFMPEAVAGGPSLLVFSRHRQACAGETLVRFVLTAVLAALLTRGRFTLERPALQPQRLPLQIDHFALCLRVQHEPLPGGA